ncbi:MAG: tetratricopeptide repeat protein [Anaerolineaceae bacterium]|nr:tetratricopeptide repeat protein [Anaerolineaceae bacterium]MCB9102583.1 tetratricopeptide repeat protein [Anaerolineales bacterium]
MLRLKLLGYPEISIDNQPVTDVMPGKAQALLFYLAVTGQTQSRAALAGLLWGDMPEPSARTNLRKALTDLRRIAGDYLDISRQDVAFKPGSEVWIDAVRFRAYLESSGPLDVQPLQVAVDLYRGDFLSGFYVLNAPDFENWMLAEQARLREQAVQALHALATYHDRQNNLTDAMRYLRRLLALEPWREEAHHHLMRLLAHDGQRGAALVQYDTCREVLFEELGIEPGAEIVALYERIKAGKLESTLATAGGLKAEPPPTGQLGSLHNLPPQLTPFIGRGQELDTLDRLLHSPNVRLVTLMGPGGMGKTRLALASAERQLAPSTTDLSITAPFPQGVYFVSLAQLDTAEHIIPTMAEALNYALETGGQKARSARQQILDYLRYKQLLLVFDNFEHVLEGVELIIDILQMAPTVKIVTTSRERLRLHQEHVLAIKGLEFPGQERIFINEESLDCPAVELFLQSARRVQPDFELTAANWLALLEICHLVEGMPLGIELAASWVDMLPLVDIAAEIRANMDFLEADVRNLPARQRSLRAIFETSWQRLNPPEQDVFAQLSIFRGGFTRQAAEKITGASLRMLTKLADKSLLQFDKQRGRYQIHEMLRQYGAEQLITTVIDKMLIWDRYSVYYCAALHKLQPDLKGGRQRSALALIEADLENMRTAWKWASACRYVDQLAQAMASLGHFYEWQGRYQEGRQAFETAVAALQAHERDLAENGEQVTGVRLVLAQLLAWQSVFNRLLGQTETAESLLEHCLDLLDDPALAAVDTRPARAFALLQLGSSTFVANKPIYQRYRQSLELYRQLDDPWGIAMALSSLGRFTRMTGDYIKTQQLWEESLDRWRMLGNEHGLANALAELSLLARYQSHYSQAERLAQECLLLARDLGNRAAIADGLGNLAMSYYFLGKFQQAHDTLVECLALCDDLGDSQASMIACFRLGIANGGQGNFERANHYAERGLSIARQMSDSFGITLLHYLIGAIAVCRGDFVEARTKLKESVEYGRATGLLTEVSFALQELALAEYGLGNLQQARQYTVEGLQTALEAGDTISLALNILPCALLLAQQGDTPRTAELWAMIADEPWITQSAIFEAARRKIKEAVAGLSIAEFEAACAKSQTLDLRAAVPRLLAELQTLGWSSAT